MTLPHHDLERPYSDACKREERFQDIVNDKRQELLAELQDEQVAERLINDSVADPVGLLAYIYSKVARGMEGNEITRQAAYATIILKFEELLDAEAQRKAERIYDN